MRASGILLHISSLPSPYGIGTLGKAAYEFADFLKAAGQKYWQILPIGPTSYGDSPYQSFSTCLRSMVQTCAMPFSSGLLNSTISPARLKEGC